MRRILSFCALLILIAVAPKIAGGQDAGGTNITCAQRLRLARATYEAGRLHELVGTILGPQASDCFKQGFTIQEKVDALKLLTLAHIYLENPVEADQAMLELLRTDHFYMPDKTSDPAEYYALWETFRTTPLITFSGRFGGTMTLPTLTTVYTASPNANGKFSPGTSFQAGLGVEREFFAKNDGFLGHTEFIGEVMYVSRTFNQKDGNLYEKGFPDATPADPTSPVARNNYKSKAGWLDFNLFLKYRFNKEHTKWDPYVGLGAGISLLLSYDIALIQTQRVRGDGGNVLTATVTGPSIDVKDSFRPIANTVTALGGVKTKLGAIFLVFEARAQFGLTSLVNANARTNSELVMDYHKQLNDFRQSNFSLNIGVTFPYYKPKKLSRKK